MTSTQSPALRSGRSRVPRGAKGQLKIIGLAGFARHYPGGPRANQPSTRSVISAQQLVLDLLMQ